jgi:hypothetical protein
MFPELEKLPCKLFPVQHTDFYYVLAEWRKELGYKPEFVFDNCVYILFVSSPIPRLIGYDYRVVLYIGEGT